jgi:hypothetical protein
MVGYLSAAAVAAVTRGAVPHFKSSTGVKGVFSRERGETFTAQAA